MPAIVVNLGLIGACPDKNQDAAQNNCLDHNHKLGRAKYYGRAKHNCDGQGRHVFRLGSDGAAAVPIGNHWAKYGVID